MGMEFINLTAENLDSEHVCCAIADKKHQNGVAAKKAWLKKRLAEGHVFRKLDEKGKVFIEYAPLDKAWVPVSGDHYVYIYCLWVSGSFKGKGHGKSLLSYCLDDAKRLGYSGVCAMSSQKKKPFLSDKKFLEKFGFKAVDTIGNYELLALSFDSAEPPHFSISVSKGSINDAALTIYYSPQCPYALNCIDQVEHYCKADGIPLNLIAVDTLEKAKSVPCVFNNWAVFYGGSFKTVHLLNEGYLKKMLDQHQKI